MTEPLVIKSEPEPDLTIPTEPAKPSKKASKPKADKPKVSDVDILDSFNHDVNAITKLNDRDAIRLGNLANTSPDLPLAGPVRYLLNVRLNDALAKKDS